MLDLDGLDLEAIPPRSGPRQTFVEDFMSERINCRCPEWPWSSCRRIRWIIPLVVLGLLRNESRPPTSRAYAREIAAGGAPVVIVLPALRPSESKAVLGILTALLRGPLERRRLLKVIEKVRRYLASPSWRQNAVKAEELALDVCLFASRDLAP